ncbi:MAG: OmpA family protein, partial [Sciscionella sp.]
EVWWSTTVLTGSTDPLSMSDLESFAEPRDAADTLLNGPLGNLDLHGIVLHPILLTPVGGGQRPLDPRSEMWRSAFVTDLTSGLGAKVLPPIHDGSTPKAWSHSSSVEPISPRPDVTPTNPQEPDTLKISDVGFVPDTATLINPDGARRRLDKIVQAYRHSHGRTVVEVTGYCAHYGKQGTARTLSRRRAATIASLLRDIGAIPAADIAAPVGVGFDQLADPRRPPRSAAQRVVIVRLQPIHSPS